MDSSSDDENVFICRKSTGKKIFDSDDETDDKVKVDATEATEDFKLHLSDEDDDGNSVQAKIDAALDEHEKESSMKDGDQDWSLLPKDDSHDSSNINKNTDSRAACKSTNAFGTPGTADIMKKLSALADSDSESDVDGDLKPAIKSSKKVKSSSKNMLASSSDSESDQDLHPSDDNPKKPIATSKEQKRKPGPERKSKTKAKDAMLEIKSESQKQLRQSSIGLPYHVPKQRSLLDFLNRRKPSSPMSIKGPVEQLTTVWKQIEEREKEVEEFYKSESEQESDEDDNEEAQDVVEQPENVSAAEPSSEAPKEATQDENSELVTGTNEGNDLESNVPPLSTDPNKKLISEASDEALSVECDSAEKMDTGGAMEENVTEKEAEQGSNQITSLESSLKNPVSVQKSFLEKSHSLLCTEDSQDISLHLSETQGTTENDLNEGPKDVPTNTKTAAENVSSEPLLKESDNEKDKSSTEEITIKKNNEWEELSAAMKNIGHDSESEPEDTVSEDIIPKNPTLGSGPRLSLKGAPNDVIDLDFTSNQTRTPGVKGLIERFMKHSASKKKPPQAQTVELSLISSEKDTAGGVVDLKHESLRIVLTTSPDKPCSQNPTPGARLKLLKSELNRQMRKQKEEEWQKKQEEMKNEAVFEGEKDDCGMLEDDEEEEEEMTDSEAESEPEVNDVRESKKKKKSKSLFVDEEAEVEDDEDAGVDDNVDDENDDSDVSENDDNGNDNDDDSESEEGDGQVIDQTLNAVSPVNSPQKINQGLDSNMGTASRLKRTMTAASTDMFASQTSEWRAGAEHEDDFIPAGQPNGIGRVESFDEISDHTKEKSMLFSPMSLSIPGKTQSFMDTDHEVTPTKLPWPTESKSQSGIKKLFGESQTFSTQDKLNELAGLFAGKFNESESSVAELADVCGNGESETDLMDLCSGKFFTQPPRPDEMEGDCAQTASSPTTQVSSQTPLVKALQVPALLAEDSVDFSLKFDEVNKNAEDSDKGSKEDLDKFRLEIMSSDEEDSAPLTKEKKKKNRKLEFSDDEDNEDDPIQSDTEQSDCENEESRGSNEQSNKLFGIFSKQPKEVYYDSDENEIEAGDFLDKEAELSEEEDWHGSDDEDEKGLDQLEMNEADKEDIDQDLVREQLVKNHMQKMLDEDRRDVRILQEMLLEDGELHSDTGGRERQFRWRNVDAGGMGDDGPRSDEEHAENDEDEDDAVWRKQRHEREMFLKDQREKQMKEAGCVEDDDGDEVLQNSEILQLGKSILFKSRSSSLDMSAPKEPLPAKLTVHNQLLSPEGKKNHMLLTKRGSFLSRGDSVLAKLAKISGPAKENVLSGAKTSGNFVFSAVSPTKKETQCEEKFDQKSSKRKASVGMPNPAGKKPCLVNSSGKGRGLFDHL